jgi:hypothetical protein
MTMSVRWTMLQAVMVCGLLFPASARAGDQDLHLLAVTLAGPDALVLGNALGLASADVVLAARHQTPSRGYAVAEVVASGMEAAFFIGQLVWLQTIRDPDAGPGSIVTGCLALLPLATLAHGFFTLIAGEPPASAPPEISIAPVGHRGLTVSISAKF